MSYAGFYAIHDHISPNVNMDRPDKGFNHCSSFNINETRVSKPPRRQTGTKENCPKHGLNENYDMNRIRMVDNVKYNIMGQDVEYV